MVIVGGGAHGLAIAYELAKRGITDVAVLERSYIGAGGSGRNTTIIRANYRTPEGVAFYKEALSLYEQLAQELDYNLLFSQQGHLTLAHAERAVNVAHERAEVNRLLGRGLARDLPGRDRASSVRELDLSDRPAFPIMAALYHPPGGVIRHDAVVWAYARQADRMGVAHPPGHRASRASTSTDGKVTGVRTTAGDISTGWSSRRSPAGRREIARMAGVRVPIVTHPLQAFVTEPLKPFLDVILVSATLHVYVSQTDRGEVLIGSEIEPYSSYSQGSTLDFLEVTAEHTLELLPILGTGEADARVGRPVRRDARLLADHGRDRGRGVPDRRRLGDVRLQGHADLRRHDGRAGRHGTGPGADRAVRARSRFWDRRLVSEIAAAAVSH